MKKDLLAPRFEVTEADFIMSESEQWELAGAGLIAYDEIRQEEALLNLFDKRCFDDDFKGMPFYLRWFYWFKCFICLGFKWTNGSYLGNSINILNWDERGYGEYGTSWDSCWIEMGVFKNWKVCVCTDGT